jgi:7-cyano-7-deazaguanine synthase
VVAVNHPSVVLVSGGVESVTLLHHLVDRGELVQALFLDYGQRAASQERHAAQWQCSHLGVELERFDLASIGQRFRAAQRVNLHIPLPHRNLVALALALSYATGLGSTRIYLAANHEDTQAYSSSSAPFLTEFGRLAETLGEVRLVTPFLEFSKVEIIRIGVILGIDYAQTHSCMLGYPSHCGRCAQCRRRRAAFREAGVAETDGVYAR